MQAAPPAKPEGQHCQLLGGSGGGKQEHLWEEQLEHRRCHLSAAVKPLPQFPRCGKDQSQEKLLLVSGGKNLQYVISVQDRKSVV